MASRSTNTMQEALQKFNRDIADMKTLPDADMPFLVELENMVLARMKQPVDALVQSGQLPQGGIPMQAPGNPAGSLQSGGFMAGAVPPPSGEIERLLGAGAPGL